MVVEIVQTVDQAVKVRVPIEHLDTASVHHHGKTVSCALGLPIVPICALRQPERLYLPIHLENGNGQIWVDRYYIAYMLRDNVVRYVYLTKRYIREERVGCKDYPELITREMLDDFREAARNMRKTDSRIYVFSDRLQQLRRLMLERSRHVKGR